MKASLFSHLRWPRIIGFCSPWRLGLRPCSLATFAVLKFLSTITARPSASLFSHILAFSSEWQLDHSFRYSATFGGLRFANSYRNDASVFGIVIRLLSQTSNSWFPLTITARPPVMLFSHLQGPRSLDFFTSWELGLLWRRIQHCDIGLWIHLFS